jgi:hypothetical protein
MRQVMPLLLRTLSCAELIGDANFLPEADFDDDGCVGQSDLGVLLSNFGS